MNAIEIKYFLRFLKEKNFNKRYKEYFYDSKIGVNCRKIQHKNLYKQINTISDFLKWANTGQTFYGFWWITTNFDHCHELSKLRSEWLEYIKTKKTNE